MWIYSYVYMLYLLFSSGLLLRLNAIQLVELQEIAYINCKMPLCNTLTCGSLYLLIIFTIKFINGLEELMMVAADPTNFVALSAVQTYSKYQYSSYFIADAEVRIVFVCIPTLLSTYFYYVNMPIRMKNKYIKNK